MSREFALNAEAGAPEYPMTLEKTETLTEQQILEEVTAGNKEAFSHIVTRYMTRAYSIALGYVHNHQDALDLSQECFIKIYRKLKRYDPKGESIS